MKFKYFRLFRESTESWLCIESPKPLTFNNATEYFKYRYEGWILYEGLVEKPNEMKEEAI